MSSKVKMKMKRCCEVWPGSFAKRPWEQISREKKAAEDQG